MVRLELLKQHLKSFYSRWEVKTLSGFVGKDKNTDASLTKMMGKSNISRIAIFPRVISLNNPGYSLNNSRVYVRLFNMSAKVVCIPSKSNIYDLSFFTFLSLRTYTWRRVFLIHFFA